MTTLRAEFHDGRSSTRHEVTLTLLPDGGIRVGFDTTSVYFPREQLHVRDRVGRNSPRLIEFTTGASAHVPPGDDVDDRLDAFAVSGTTGTVRRLESSWIAAIVALVVLVSASVGFVRFGIPAMADRIAAMVPPELDARLGNEALERFDDEMLEPSSLPPSRRRELQQRFDSMAVQIGAPAGTRLEFRSAPLIGPNAFALPGDIVVLLDELVTAAKHDDEIAAVLAHELGHVRERHALQGGVESLGFGILLMFFTGDLTAMGSLATALPAVLVQSGYSRAAEREADAIAFMWLDQQGIPRTRLTDFLERQQAEHGAGLPSVLSTHPSTEERAAVARGGKPPPP